MNIFKIISLRDDDYGEVRDSLADSYSGMGSSRNYQGSYAGSITSGQWSTMSVNDKTFKIGTSNALRAMEDSLYRDQQVCADIERCSEFSAFIIYMNDNPESNLSTLIDRLEQYVIFKYTPNEDIADQTATTISNDFKAVLGDDTISDPIKQAIIMYALKSTQQQRFAPTVKSGVHYPITGTFIGELLQDTKFDDAWKTLKTVGDLGGYKDAVALSLKRLTITSLKESVQMEPKSKIGVEALTQFKKELFNTSSQKSGRRRCLMFLFTDLDVMRVLLAMSPIQPASNEDDKNKLALVLDRLTQAIKDNRGAQLNTFSKVFRRALAEKRDWIIPTRSGDGQLKVTFDLRDSEILKTFFNDGAFDFSSITEKKLKCLDLGQVMDLLIAAIFMNPYLGTNILKESMASCLNEGGQSHFVTQRRIKSNSIDLFIETINKNNDPRETYEQMWLVEMVCRLAENCSSISVEDEGFKGHLARTYRELIEDGFLGDQNRKVRDEYVASVKMGNQDPMTKYQDLWTTKDKLIQAFCTKLYNDQLRQPLVKTWNIMVATQASLAQMQWQSVQNTELEIAGQNLPSAKWTGYICEDEGIRILQVSIDELSAISIQALARLTVDYGDKVLEWDVLDPNHTSFDIKKLEEVLCLSYAENDNHSNGYPIEDIVKSLSVDGIKKLPHSIRSRITGVLNKYPYLDIRADKRITLLETCSFEQVITNLNRHSTRTIGTIAIDFDRYESVINGLDLQDIKQFFSAKPNIELTDGLAKILSDQLTSSDFLEAIPVLSEIAAVLTTSRDVWQHVSTVSVADLNGLSILSKAKILTLLSLADRGTLDNDRLIALMTTSQEVATLVLSKSSDEVQGLSVDSKIKILTLLSGPDFSSLSNEKFIALIHGFDVDTFSTCGAQGGDKSAYIVSRLDTNEIRDLDFQTRLTLIRAMSIQAIRRIGGAYGGKGAAFLNDKGKPGDSCDEEVRVIGKLSLDRRQALKAYYHAPRFMVTRRTDFYSTFFR